MATWLKQSTASQTVQIGPFLDDTDGKTAETGLTIANTDIKLNKGGATSQSNKNSGGATHIANGYYYATLDATDTATLGRLMLSVNASGALPVWHEYMVMPANVYDSLVEGSGTDYLQVDVIQLGGGTQSATDLKDFADEGYDPSTNKVTEVATLTGHTAQTGDSYALANGANGFAAIKTQTAAIETDTQDIQGRLPAALVSGRMSSDAVAISGSTAAADSVEANIGNLDASIAGLNDLSAAEVNAEVDAALNTAIPGTPTADSINERIKAIDDKLPSKSYLTGTANSDGDVEADGMTGNFAGSVASVVGAVGSVTGAVGSVTGAVGSVTGNVGGTINGLTATALADFFDTDSGTTYAAAAAGSVVKEIADNAGGSALTEAGIADAVWNELSTGHTDAGKAGAQLWTKIDDIVNNGVAVKTNGIAAASIQDNAITAAKIATDAIDSDAMADGAITTGTFAPSAINATVIAANAIGASQLADGAIDNATFAADVGSTALGSNMIALAADKCHKEYNLDHLMKSAVDTDIPTTVNLASVIGYMMDDGTAWSYDRTSDSLEALAGGGASADWTTGEKNQIRQALGVTGTTAATTGSGNVDLILADTGTDGVVVAAGSKTGYTLAASQPGVTIPTVTTLTGHFPQTGDSYARLGAPAGASVSADIAAVKAQTAAIENDTGTTGVVVAAGSKTGYSLANGSITADVIADNAIDAGSIAANAIASTKIADNAITSAKIASNAITADKINGDAITAAKIATGAIDADALAADFLTAVADAILKRDWNSVSGESDRSVLQALRFLRNKWSISGSTLTVTKENDTTSAWTATVGTTSGADPISSVDPA